MTDEPSKPTDRPTPVPNLEYAQEKATTADPEVRRQRRRAAIIAAATLALLTLAVVLAARDDETVSAGSRTTASTPRGAAEQEEDAPAESSADEDEDETDPSSGPPYIAVPEFSSEAARDVAFVGDVGQFTTWPSATEYDAMSSMGGAYEVVDFRKAVIRDAESVCDALAGGTHMNDVPDVAEVALTDPIDQAAFIVEAVTFYCSDQMAAATGDVYSEPVPTEQDEDCPTASALKVTAAMEPDPDDRTSATYSAKVRNTSSYDVRVQLQQRWFADRAPGEQFDPVWEPEWESFGDMTEDLFFTVEAGKTFTYEGEQDGVYYWSGTEVRVKPGEFVFFGCGYRPGPDPLA
ncbi:DUF732 domain-containing protein [Streptomyces apricus]|uniref:Transposase n=1 Tax=Streptomyces apricus TaxID=1828112 RepID=A0A5B0BDA4_9ACTN|nr:DUF732 domain-containing protein [Streptomyces apricus]KAA0940248.1 transposase [Streptomyces apricus]